MNFRQHVINTMADHYGLCSGDFRDIEVGDLWKAMDHSTQKELILGYWKDSREGLDCCLDMDGGKYREMVEAAIVRGDSAEAGHIIERAALRWGEPQLLAYMNDEELMNSAYRQATGETA